MKKSVSVEQMMPLMREMLDGGGEVRFSPRGTSMRPLLEGGRDSVTLKKPSGKLKKLDVALYRRDNGDYVLHRVVKVEPDSYVMCGDNQTALEKGITDGMVVAVMTGLCRNGRNVDCSGAGYRFYSGAWTALMFMRPVLRFAASLPRRIGKKDGTGAGEKYDRT